MCLIFFASEKKLKSSSRKRLDLGYLVKGFRRNCLEISEIKITSKSVSSKWLQNSRTPVKALPWKFPCAKYEQKLFWGSLSLDIKSRSV